MSKEDLAVYVSNLSYTFPESEVPSLVDINLEVPWNTRTLVVGCNGAGKSTLLRLLSGKHLCRNGELLVNGLDPFAPISLTKKRQEDVDVQTTTYLGTEWCHMTIINRDIGVTELLNSIGMKVYQERCDTLVDILDIDLNWRMHRLSDGQKRRVQLAMGLLKPWRILLLDEVTVDLDVICRSRLLNFLKFETESRKCSVIYATHIFDGLANWPNRILHMDYGKIVSDVDYKKDIKFTENIGDMENGKVIKDENNKIIISKVNSLHPLALHWLNNDLGLPEL
ncbi:hypothetical protein Kpol_1035p32 [Vanderwaltozyma polyspora DSM 70294]|uniref:ABC transporter domain-containing protein n=1 Tax=Vanderwaltozyma polyspora (strain ATCC 22028 / DSM 70294 / BCRC 21397 / CBS 2163 / NBRC 10782 / NRRL Y-8283 / UCD 57-17) TaxID=436907 RepID=A7TKJ7_VANPO|nr:uncharacterized protein Kpol_1035p32 [Vanderwaltozyma polyspora DSM 70294]EDO17219.1 hypothetical protein Kpol_1035p32 [Vanderwaltozyma polyspora DSM 70294]